MSSTLSFSADDIANWTTVADLGDDTCLFNIPLGFTHVAFGRSVSTISVSSNGVLFLGQGCSTSFFNTPLPAGISNDPFLAFFWDDLRDYGGGEYVQYATLGTAGGRVFNMLFRNRLFTDACGPNAIQAMISIHEGGPITVRYTPQGGCASLRGASATIGLQGPGAAAAQDAVTVSVDSPVIDDNAPVQTISFRPPQ